MRVEDRTECALRRREEAAPEPGDDPVWSWAFEWNKNYRVIGLVGARPAMTSVFEKLPKLDMHRVDPHTRVRSEVPLSDGEEHLLFAEPPEIQQARPEVET